LQRDELDGWKSNWGKSRKEEHFALCPQAGTSPQMRQQQTGTQLTELLLGVYLKTIQEVSFVPTHDKFGIRVALLVVGGMERRRVLA
jgi:hypothetical protein